MSPEEIEELIEVCAQCGSADAHETSAEVTYCPDCQSVEGGYTTITLKEYEEADS